MSEKPNIVSPERIPRQVRNYKESLLQTYYHFVFGDRFTKKHVSEGDRVLDVGCGAGRSISPLISSNTDPVGIDLSRDAVRTAVNCLGDKSVSCVAGDAMRLPFANNSFDVVQLAGVLSGVKKPKLLILECKRVLKSGGTLIYNLVNADTILPHKLSSAPGSNRLKPTLEATRSAGFAIDKIYTNFFIGSQQKKLIFSSRIPIFIRWVGLFISILINEILRHTPGVRNRGGLFWVVCTLRS